MQMYLMTFGILIQSHFWIKIKRDAIGALIEINQHARSRQALRFDLDLP
jgi:hypothetical protein